MSKPLIIGKVLWWKGTDGWKYLYTEHCPWFDVGVRWRGWRVRVFGRWNLNKGE